MRKCGWPRTRPPEDGNGIITASRAPKQKAVGRRRCCPFNNGPAKCATGIDKEHDMQRQEQITLRDYKKTYLWVNYTRAVEDLASYFGEFYPQFKWCFESATPDE